MFGLNRFGDGAMRTGTLTRLVMLIVGAARGDRRQVLHGDTVVSDYIPVFDDQLCLLSSR